MVHKARDTDIPECRTRERGFGDAGFAQLLDAESGQLVAKVLQSFPAVQKAVDQNIRQGRFPNIRRPDNIRISSIQVFPEIPRQGLDATILVHPDGIFRAQVNIRRLYHRRGPLVEEALQLFVAAALTDIVG